MRINIYKVPQRAEASKYGKVSKNAQSAQSESEHMYPVSCTQSVPYLVVDNELTLLACLPNICVHGLQQLLAIGMRLDCMRHCWQHQSKDSGHQTFHSSNLSDE